MTVLALPIAEMYRPSALILRRLRSGEVPSESEIRSILYSEKDLHPEFKEWLEQYCSGKIKRPKGRPTGRPDMNKLLFRSCVPFIVPAMAEEEDLSEEQCRQILAKKHGVSESIVLDLQYPIRAEDRALKQRAKARKRQCVFNNKASAAAA